MVLVVVAAFAALVAAGQPSVDDTGPVYFGAAVRGPVDKKLASDFKASVEQALAKQGVKVLDAGGSAEDTVAAASATARAALADATAAYSDDDWSTALADDDRALQAFEQGPAYTDDDQAWALYRDIMSLRALIHLKQKKRKEADEAVKNLLAVLPRYAPNREKAPPELVRHVDDVKDELRSLPPSSIEVQSRPSGAKIIVDGKRRGRAPLVIDDMYPGVHYVGVEGPSGRYSERVVVGEGNATVNAKLGSRKGAAARDIVRMLEKPTTAKDFVESITGVDDDAIVVLLLPRGTKRVELIGARVRDGEVKNVFGTWSVDDEGPREKATYTLVESLLAGRNTDKSGKALATSKDARMAGADGWQGEAAGTEKLDDLRPTFFAGIGTREDPEEDVPPEPTNPAVIASAVVGGVVAVAGIGAVVGIYLFNESRKDQGFTFAVDTSQLP